MTSATARLSGLWRCVGVRHVFLSAGLLLAIAALGCSLRLDAALPAVHQLQPAMFALAAAIFIYSVSLWRFMRRREDVECQLQNAKDAADKANSARGEFLSTMSHEIRTPMNAILGMAGLIRTTPLDAQQDGFAKGIEESAQSLMNIIDDVLDFSKIDAGKLDIEAREVELLGIVEASVDVLASRAREKGVRLSSYVDTNLPDMVRGDPGRLRQILLNLLSNAVKFTSFGEIAVSARLVDEAPGQCRIRFQVTDTGVGIDSRALDKLFMPFVQADGSVTRKYGGTGLGLSICKRLVSLMGGQIGVESRVGHGSAFWFELAMPVIKKAGNSNQLQGEMLLVAPDDESARALRKYAAAAGMSVRSALSLGQGRELAARLAPGAIVVIDTAVHDFCLEKLAEVRTAWNRAGAWLLLAADEDVRDDLAMATDAPILMLPLRKDVFCNALAARSIPPAIPDAAKPAAPDEQTAVPPVKKTYVNLPILLVEDNLMNQKVAVHQLNFLGYDVDVAVNGREALAMLDRGTYAAVLMDCQMPEMDGFEATRRIRAGEHTSGRHITVIAMTANAMMGDRERCLEAGMDDYLSKPILRDRLESVLAGHVQRHGSAAGSGLGAGQPEALDMRRLQELFDDDRDTMQSMLSFFVVNTRPVIDALQQAALNRDIPAALELLHRLAGSAGNLGASRIAALAGVAEAAAREGDCLQLNQRCQELLKAFHCVQQRIEEMKETT
ncbi:ATP-binding protein [Herbaspirillum sp. NPDC101396]|uniref:ATP-binding protein n=1 Tax=Herbaspirillum sp. NPDC101396 TaxID=3364005 RepID=UPI00383A7C33